MKIKRYSESLSNNLSVLDFIKEVNNLYDDIIDECAELEDDGFTLGVTYCYNNDWNKIEIETFKYFYYREDGLSSIYKNLYESRLSSRDKNVVLKYLYDTDFKDFRTDVRSANVSETFINTDYSIVTDYNKKLSNIINLDKYLRSSFSGIKTYLNIDKFLKIEYFIIRDAS